MRVAKFEFGTIVEVSSDVDIAALKVDVTKLVSCPSLDTTPTEERSNAQLPDYSTLFIITQVSGASGDAAKINTRVFCPGIGIPEDPVTGYAHAALTAYYLGGVGRASVEAVLPGVDVTKVSLDARQLSARGGALVCSLANGRAQLAGLGWRTAKGELDVLP